MLTSTNLIKHSNKHYLHPSIAQSLFIWDNLPYIMIRYIISFVQSPILVRCNVKVFKIIKDQIWIFFGPGYVLSLKRPGEAQEPCPYYGTRVFTDENMGLCLYIHRTLVQEIVQYCRQLNISEYINSEQLDTQPNKGNLNCFE